MADNEAGSENGLRSPFEREDALLKEIGRAVALWGAVHHVLRALTANRLNITSPKVDELLGDFSGEGAKIKFLTNLVASREDKADASLIQALNRLTKLIPDRNIIVHGGPIWGMDRDYYEPGFHLVNFKQPKKDKRTKPALPFVIEHIKRLRIAGGELHGIVHEELNRFFDSIKEPTPTSK